MKKTTQLNQDSQEHIFVVDTDMYVGSFERELCAYATGIVGECEVGIMNQEQFNVARKVDKTIPSFEEALKLRADAQGCSRPVAMWPTPGWFSSGYGLEFRGGQEKEALASYKKEAVAQFSFEIKNSKRTRAALLRGGSCSTWMLSAIDQELKDSRKKLNEINEQTELTKHPVYNSVAIFFVGKPSEEMLSCLKRRCAEFASGIVVTRKSKFEGNPKFKIEGFRLLKHVPGTETLVGRWD